MRPAGWRAGPAPFKGSLPSAQQFTAVPASQTEAGSVTRDICPAAQQQHGRNRGNESGIRAVLG
jgi:hypothetical protein